MTEEERISTLEELKKTKSELSGILFSLPISMKTQAL